MVCRSSGAEPTALLGSLTPWAGDERCLVLGNFHALDIVRVRFLLYNCRQVFSQAVGDRAWTHAVPARLWVHSSADRTCVHLSLIFFPMPFGLSNINILILLETSVHAVISTAWQCAAVIQSKPRTWRNFWRIRFDWLLGSYYYPVSRRWASWCWLFLGRFQETLPDEHTYASKETVWFFLVRREVLEIHSP